MLSRWRYAAYAPPARHSSSGSTGPTSTACSPAQNRRSDAAASGVGRTGAPRNPRLSVGRSWLRRQGTTVRTARADEAFPMELKKNKRNALRLHPRRRSVARTSDRRSRWSGRSGGERCAGALPASAVVVMLLVALAFFAGDFDQCNCDLHPDAANCQASGGGSGAPVACTGDGGYTGCISSPNPVGAPPAAPPPPPTAPAATTSRYMSTRCTDNFVRRGLAAAVHADENGIVILHISGGRSIKDLRSAHCSWTF